MTRIRRLDKAVEPRPQQARQVTQPLGTVEGIGRRAFAEDHLPRRLEVATEIAPHGAIDNASLFRGHGVTNARPRTRPVSRSSPAPASGSGASHARGSCNLTSRNAHVVTREFLRPQFYTMRLPPMRWTPSRWACEDAGPRARRKRMTSELAGPATHSPAVLITGTSTGIGRSTTHLLDREGWSVFAGLRREADADRLRAECSERVTPLLFDITQQDQIDRAAKQVSDALGEAPLTAIVNNAGVSFGGPLEYCDLDKTRSGFEANVFGPMAVNRAFLPLLRRGSGGRIVNVSSAAGLAATPLLGGSALPRTRRRRTRSRRRATRRVRPSRSRSSGRPRPPSGSWRGR